MWYQESLPNLIQSFPLLSLVFLAEIKIDFEEFDHNNEEQNITNHIKQSSSTEKNQR